MTKRDPYNIATWGPECARGIRPKNLGTTIEGRPAVRKMSGGRKPHAPAKTNQNGGRP